MKNRVDYARVRAAIRAGKSNEDIRREIDGRLKDRTLNEMRVRLGAVQDMDTRDIAEAIVGGAEETTEETTEETREEEGMKDEETMNTAEAEAVRESETCEQGVPEITGKAVSVMLSARGEKYCYDLDNNGCLIVMDEDREIVLSLMMGELKQIVREALWLEAEIEKELARHE